MFTGSNSDAVEVKTNATPIQPWQTTDIYGERYTSESTSGKASLVVFWATWCAPCVKEFPILVELRNEFEHNDLEIVGISVDMAGKDLKPFAKEHKLNYSLALNNESVENAFGPIKYIPTLFILDDKRVVRHRHTGNVSKSVLLAQLRNLVNSTQL